MSDNEKPRSLGQGHEACIMTGEKEGGWIEWAGGDCPVERGTVIDCRYRDGHETSDLVAQHLSSHEKIGNIIYAAHWAFWKADGSPNDIIAYRVVQP